MQRIGLLGLLVCLPIVPSVAGLVTFEAIPATGVYSDVPHGDARSPLLVFGDVTFDVTNAASFTGLGKVTTASGQSVGAIDFGIDSLTFEDVSGPSTWLSLLAGVVLLMICRRRRA